MKTTHRCRVNTQYVDFHITQKSTYFLSTQPPCVELCVFTLLMCGVSCGCVVLCISIYILCVCVGVCVCVLLCVFIYILCVCVCVVCV